MRSRSSMNLLPFRLVCGPVSKAIRRSKKIFWECSCGPRQVESRRKREKINRRYRNSTLYFLQRCGLEINMGRKKRNSIADSNPRGAGFYALLGPPHGRDVSFLPHLVAGGFRRHGCENTDPSPLARFCV